MKMSPITVCHFLPFTPSFHPPNPPRSVTPPRYTGGGDEQAVPDGGALLLY